MAAAEESGGQIIAVSDDEILNMQSRLAGQGVWVEPASAAGLAGLAAQLRAGKLHLQGKRVVAVCTGHGLKDPDIITRRMAEPLVLPANLAALEEAILAGPRKNLDDSAAG
jgi:threonine synthase